jgi:hypothetical protein
MRAAVSIIIFSSSFYDLGDILIVRMYVLRISHESKKEYLARAPFFSNVKKH